MDQKRFERDGKNKDPTALGIIFSSDKRENEPTLHISRFPDDCRMKLLELCSHVYRQEEECAS
ncbi:Uncharacterized protein APZ42_033765 [Daphnia magna]|uniref:Uncharacterized protein n=1 Tax=Daphnia magna TaxID=35525 RepID=A0A164KUK6_9CRUS|nr:Uncharacterized protein APZ42_033765 [Daphnia magna]